MQYKANSPGVYLWLIADLYSCLMDQVTREIYKRVILSEILDTKILKILCLW